ncbi:MAG: tRNA (adenosine(37)-N6)-threonylcarbamoyltransferase complex dimerization subunit type 1 TsaB [Candidatus Aminicenantes bacterium]|jgi:tRNA threonylcarbamoyladenosine biosynthesis protein TsaB
MKAILSLDTTSKSASISVAKGEAIQLEYNFTTRDELSVSLIPSLEFVLNSAGLKLTDIDVFGIGIGPGLFTGIRVGLATLKGLLMAEPKPVVPVVTLEALAYKYIEPEFTIVSLMDARRNQVYMAAYHFSRSQKQMEPVILPRLLSIHQLKERLKPLDDVNFVGSGAEVHKTFIKENFKQSKVCQRSFFLASEICKITYHAYLKKEYITDLQQLKPLYIRKPDAEQNDLQSQPPKHPKTP